MTNQLTRLRADEARYVKLIEDAEAGLTSYHPVDEDGIREEDVSPARLDELKRDLVSIRQQIAAL